MATSYDKLYANILPKFRSYDIAIMSEEEIKENLHDFLIPAITKFHICRNNLFDRNDEVGEFNSDLTDIEIEIISNYMLLEYLDSNYIRTPTLLKVSLSSSDFNAFSNANLLDKLINMHDDFLADNETLLSRYSLLGITKDSKISKYSYKK